MSTEIITAFIALGGVIVSIIASITVSMRQTTIELRKVRTEIQRAYMDKVLEKRIEHYPKLYKLLSDFDKIIRDSTLKKKHVEDLFHNILEWDSANAIFLSGQSVITYITLRIELANIVKMSEKEFYKKYIDDGEQEQLLNRANEVEVALKNDIGIYSVEFPNTDRKFKSYQEVKVFLEKGKTK